MTLYNPGCVLLYIEMEDIEQCSNWRDKSLSGGVFLVVWKYRGILGGITSFSGIFRHFRGIIKHFGYFEVYVHLKGVHYDFGLISAVALSRL